MFQAEAVEARSTLKRRAINVERNPSAIINSTRADLSDDARLLLQTDDALKCMIRRARARNNPAIPNSIESLVIDGEWAETLCEHPERYLFFDNGTDAQYRILLFASNSALCKQASASVWFMDGNFLMSPPGFLQMCVIRVPYRNYNYLSPCYKTGLPTMRCSMLSWIIVKSLDCFMILLLSCRDPIHC